MPEETVSIELGEEELSILNQVRQRALQLGISLDIAICQAFAIYVKRDEELS